MHIGNKRTVKLLETADIHILADSRDLVGHILLDGHITALYGNIVKSLNIGSLVCDGVGDSLNKLQELVGLSAEIGLTVDLNNNAVRTLYLCLHNALGSNSACLLCSLCKTLFAQNLYSLLAVVVSFLKSLLTVGQAAARHIAKLFYLLYISHYFISLYLTIFNYSAYSAGVSSAAASAVP